MATSPSKLFLSSSNLARDSRILVSYLSSPAMLDSSSLLFSLSRSSFFLWSSRSAFFLSRKSLALPYCSPVSLINSSLLREFSTVSCHWRYSWCRSPCNRLNSSAVLSSSIYAAWVSVTSYSSSLALRPTSMVSFSMLRVNSLIFASSARRYFSRVRLSSSFCLAASAHCSSSS